MTPIEAAVRVWQDAGPVLNRLRRRELRELTEEEAPRGDAGPPRPHYDPATQDGRFGAGRAAAVLRPRRQVNPILQAAAEIDCFCTERGMQFCIIGGLAVLRWGQPRLTRVVDLTIVAGLARRGRSSIRCSGCSAHRATRWTIQDDLAVLTCGPEDLVVHKVFAGRDQDWLDVAGVIERRGDALDRQLTRSELAPLLKLKGTTPPLARLEELFAYG